MRRTEQSMDRASALASLVLPTPGTSSMSRCPSASMTARASRTVAVLPSITRSMLSTMAPVPAENSGADSGPPKSSAVLGIVTGPLLNCDAVASADHGIPGSGTRRLGIGLHRPPLCVSNQASPPAVVQPNGPFGATARPLLGQYHTRSGGRRYTAPHDPGLPA